MEDETTPGGGLEALAATNPLGCRVEIDPVAGLFLMRVTWGDGADLVTEPVPFCCPQHVAQGINDMLHVVAQTRAAVLAGEFTPPTQGEPVH